MNENFVDTDTALNHLRNQGKLVLETITFKTPLAVADQDYAQAVFTGQQHQGVKAVLKHCHMFPKQSWHVALFLCGKYHIVGRAQGGDKYAAVMRYADMALLHFWAYRTQSRAPKNKDFNFSLAQARGDYEENQDIVLWLEQIEKHMVASAMITLPNRAVKSTREKPGSMREQLNRIEAALKRLEAK